MKQTPMSDFQRFPTTPTVQSMVTIRGLFRTQIPEMNLFVKRVNGFQQKAPSQMFE